MQKITPERLALEREALEWLHELNATNPAFRVAVGWLEEAHPARRSVNWRCTLNRARTTMNRHWGIYVFHDTMFAAALWVDLPMELRDGVVYVGMSQRFLREADRVHADRVRRGGPYWPQHPYLSEHRPEYAPPGHWSLRQQRQH